MKIYCLVIGAVFLLGSVLLMLHRLYFIFRAIKVPAVVAAKVYRNASTETRSSRAKVLKLTFEHPASGQEEHICDTSLLTPIFKINDKLYLSVRNNKVLINHWFYLILAPAALLIFGVVCIYTSSQM